MEASQVPPHQLAHPCPYGPVILASERSVKTQKGRKMLKWGHNNCKKMQNDTIMHKDHLTLLKPFLIIVPWSLLKAPPNLNTHGLT